jgi:hypothetical protein
MLFAQHRLTQPKLFESDHATDKGLPGAFGYLLVRHLSTPQPSLTSYIEAIPAAGGWMGLGGP